ncbi:MAG: hypothetical protein KatS3mg026_1703 [Bacteroidia bacterium]|nr:MAG: hypothetical protein KatS3mg026_1703 [Bacteroidia bacterium]
MRPIALLFFLTLVGLAAWLVWDKLAARRKTLPAEEAEKAPVQITDTLQEAASGVRSPEKPARPSKQPSTPPASAKGLALEALYASVSGCQVVRHRYYALCYDEAAEQARWTVHVLEGRRLAQSRVRRTQDFRPDAAVATASAQLQDYARSGYDRGHLVPAGDFKWDSVGMSETFYLSNMSPQLHEFNAGIWEEVESTVRAWARQKGRLVVYTGPVLDRPSGYIGPNRVAVPRAFYKVVYALEGEAPAAAVGFLVPHKPSRRPPLEFLVPVDSVEKVTGVDFWPALPDPLEARLESRVDKTFWSAPVSRRRR